MVTMYKCAYCRKEIKYTHAAIEDAQENVFCNRLCWSGYKRRQESYSSTIHPAYPELAAYKNRLRIAYTAILTLGILAAIALFIHFRPRIVFQTREPQAQPPQVGGTPRIPEKERHIVVGPREAPRKVERLTITGIIEDEPKVVQRSVEGKGEEKEETRIETASAKEEPIPKTEPAGEKEKRLYLLRRAKQLTDQGDAALKMGNKELAKKYYEGATKVHSRVYPNMAYVAPGKFTRGSTKGHAEEKPAAEIYLDGFWMDKYEVTNEDYRKFVEATGHKVPYNAHAGGGWADPYNWDRVNKTYPEGKANHPVVFVSWQDASDYASWAGKRLPTEAEWEKAARGVDGRMWPWGNDWKPGMCNSSERLAKRRLWNLEEWDTWYNKWLKLDPIERNEDTNMPVGSYPDGRSPFGLYDMAGNVYEWCADWWDEDFYKRAESKQNNPMCDARSSSKKVMKGGSWRRHGSDSVRCAHRSCYPYNRVDWPDIGFRCVRSPGDGL
jgi:formylglycine-generating enzyme required for sulfatase activity